MMTAAHGLVNVGILARPAMDPFLAIVSLETISPLAVSPLLAVSPPEAASEIRVARESTPEERIAREPFR